MAMPKKKNNNTKKAAQNFDLTKGSLTLYFAML